MTTRIPSRLSLAAKTTALFVALGHISTAGILYWDGNGTGASGNPPTTGAGVSGAWNAGTNANWWTGTAYQLWNATGGEDIADFRGTAGTVTTSGTVNVNQMLIRTNTYLFSSGTINFTGTQGILDVFATNSSIFSSNATGNLKVQSTGNTATLASAAPLIINGSTNLTSFELALATDNNHIILGNAAALGSAASTVKLTKGVLNLGQTSGASTFSYNAWATDLAGGTIRARFDTSTWNGATSLSANAQLMTRNAANVKLVFSSTGTINLNDKTLNLMSGATSLGIELNGVISGTGNIATAENKLGGSDLGNGTTVLNAANTFSGTATTTLNLGTFALGNVNALQNATLNTGSASGSQSVAFMVAGTNTYHIGALAGSDDLAIGANTISVGSKAVDTVFGADISGASGSLTKVGANQLTLAAATTYSGVTSITGGTLALTGSGAINGSSGIDINGAGAKFLHAGSTTVSPNVTLTQGTLTGNGTLTTVNVGAGTGGVVSNNNGIGGAALTITNLNLAGAAAINLFGNGADTTANLIVGTLTNNSAANAVTITANNVSGWTNGSTYNLIGYTTLGGTGGNNFAHVVNNLSARQAAAWGDSGSAITLAISGDNPYWTGAADGNWNTAATNWKLVTAGTDTQFLATDDVLFDDNATGTTTIDINAADVGPNTTVFNNTIAKDYVLGSSGGFGVISGSLSKNNNGKVTITNANSYTGGTTLNAGTLVINNVNALGSAASAFTINGGTLDTTAGDLTTVNHGLTINGDFVFTGTNNLNLGTGAASLGSFAGTSRTITVNAGILTLGNAISNGTTANTLIKTGAGTLVLSGANSLAGVTVNGGTLTAQNATALGAAATLTSGTLNLNAAAMAGTLTINGGVLDNTSGAALTTANAARTINSDFTFTGSNDLNLGTGAISLGSAAGTARNITVSASTLTLGGAISDGTTATGLTKSGAGTLVLSAANTFTGLTTISGGTVRAGNAAALGSNVGGTIINAGGVFDFNGIALASGENFELAGGKLTNTGAIQLNAVNGAVTVTADSRIGGVNRWDFRAAGASLVVNGGIKLIKEDANTIAMVGRSLTNDGTIQIDGGAFAFHTLGSYGGTGNYVVNNGGELQLGSYSSATKLTLANNITSNGGALASEDASGTGGAPEFSGDISLTAATTTTLRATQAGILSGDISGDGNLEKTGDSTFIVSGNNTYTGATTVTAGELRIASDTGLGTNTTITVNGGRLTLDGGRTIGSGKTVTVNGAGGAGNFFGALQGFGGTNVWEGDVIVGLTPGTRIGVNAGSLKISGGISGSNAANGLILRPNTGATLELSGANTYAGDTTIISGTGEVLLSGGSDRLPTGTRLLFGGSAVSGILNLNGQNQKVAGLAVMSGTANEIKSATAATLTVDAATDSTFGAGGKITGSTALRKEGTAKLTLSDANNTYTGKTTVAAGVLALAGGGTISSSSEINVASGATFDISAVTAPDYTIGGATAQTLSGGGASAGLIDATGKTLIMGNSATLRPGNSAGTLAVTGNLQLSTGTILNFELNPLDNTVGGAVNDLVTVSGLLTLAGNLNVSGGDFSSVTSGTWRLFEYGSLSYTPANLTLGSTPSLQSGYSWEVQDDAVNNAVNLTIVPEPSTVFLGIFGVAGLALRRRRQA